MPARWPGAHDFARIAGYEIEPASPFQEPKRSAAQGEPATAELMLEGYSTLIFPGLSISVGRIAALEATLSRLLYEVVE
jgi:hypothetical protein